MAHASDSSPFPVSRQWVPRPCVFLQGRERCCRYHGLLCPAVCIARMGRITCTLSPAPENNGDGAVIVSICLEEDGPVRVNEGWTKISFRGRVA